MYLREASRRVNKPPNEISRNSRDRLIDDRLTNQVVRHEGHCKFLGVFEVHSPERVVFWAVVLPEPWESNATGILVRVLALPVVEDHGRLREALKRVLCLGSWLLFLLGLRGLGLGGLWLSGLLRLLWCHILERLLNEDGAGHDGLVHGLVVDSFIPSCHSRVSLAPFTAQNELGSTRKESGSEKVSKSETLANKVGVFGKVLLQDSKGLEGGD